MSTKPNPPSALLIFLQASWSAAKMNVLSFQNRDQAMKQLRAKLYELELRKQQSEQQAIEDSKADIGWGSQIRSYVLDDARVKDLRTQVECRDTQRVLNGDLDQFIEASLKSGL